MIPTFFQLNYFKVMQLVHRLSLLPPSAQALSLLAPFPEPESPGQVPASVFSPPLQRSHYIVAIASLTCPLLLEIEHLGGSCCMHLEQTLNSTKAG